MKTLEQLYSYYEKNKLKLWLALLILLPLFLFVFYLLMPGLFWDRFLWRYFWGPVVADAEGRTVDGITAGYNPVNTLVYGITLVVSFFGIYELVDHFQIEIDKKFVYSLSPWIVLGGSLRSLEDAGLFKDPLDKFMISPLIYLVLGVFAVLLMVIGAVLFSSRLKKENEKILRLLVLLPAPVFYLLISGLLVDYFLWSYLVIFAGMFLSYIIGLRLFELDEKYLFFSYGSMTLFTALYHNYHHLTLDSANPIEAVLIPGLALALTVVFISVLWIIDRLLNKGREMNSYGIFPRPLNLMIVFAHLFDASSTYRGIEAYGYAEKHVIPNLLIEATGTPLIMFPMKLVLIVFVVYILDVIMKSEFYDKKSLIVLLKFVIIVLGMAPAVRNTLRLAMGV